MTGTVYLIGAGPGDPELITRRGEAILRRADCVIYDRLVNPELLKWTPRRCERIYSGKHSDEGGRGQVRINRLLAEKARRHRVVVRLKGGDPSLFGRLAEEVETLLRAGIPYEVVPGVSSVWAAAAAAGIPLTDRRLSSSVAFVTGHEARGKGSSVPWKELARGADTLVILMGWSSLGTIVRRLKTAGRSASTPVALIRQVSLPDQAILVSTLGEILRDLTRHPEFGPPVVVIVGEVVGERRVPSLEGRKVLITRPLSDSTLMSRRFERRGARCVYLPTLRVRPKPMRTSEARDFLAQLPRFDWVLFNSHHAVEALSRLARRFKQSLPRLVRGKVCAIGPRTEEAIREAGLKADLVPGESSGEGVANAFRKIPVRGRRILIPRSDQGIGDAPAKELKRQGAFVQETAVYETISLRVPAEKLRRALRGLDAVTFTSSSAVRSFAESVKEARIPLKKFLNGTPVVAIGPSTARTLRESGIRRVILPPKGSWTVEGLVEAVERAVAP